MSERGIRHASPTDGPPSPLARTRFRLLIHALLILNACGVCSVPALLAFLFLGRASPARPPFLDLSPEAIWVMDPKVRFLDDIHPLAPADLPRVREVPGVTSASPIRHAFGYAYLPSSEAQLCSLWGLDEAAAATQTCVATAGSLSDLQQSDAVLMDEAGFHHLWAGEAWRAGRTVEIDGRRAVVVGLWRSGAGIPAPDPIVWTRFDRMKPYSRHPESDGPSFILCRAEPGATPAEVCRRIEQKTGLRALPGDQLSELDTGYWWGKTHAEGAAFTYAVLSPFALSALAMGFGVSCLGLFWLSGSRDTGGQPRTGRAAAATFAKAMALGAAGALLALLVVWGVRQFGPVNSAGIKFTGTLWLSGAIAALALNLLAALAVWVIVVRSERGKAF